MHAIGFINAFDELAEKDQRLGRKVANFGLVSALLKYSSAEELHFFLPFGAALKPFEDSYHDWLAKPEIARRVRLLPAIALPGSLERTPYLAIHAAELDRYFPEMCHMRNRWARTPFPITCTTHTLSYWSTQTRNLLKVLPGVRPWDAVFCTSAAAKEHLRRAFESASFVLNDLGAKEAGYKGCLETIPLGVEADNFDLETQAAARAALGLPHADLTLLCLGRLTASDKYDLMPLLGILSLLAKNHDICLVLAGASRGSYAQEIMTAAAQSGLGGRVFLFADFDSKFKARLFKAADIFVSPADNLQETFGLTLIEAMASSLPVVASDFSGYRDIVIDGETGYLVPTTGPMDYTSLDAVWPVMTEHTFALQVAQRTALDMEVLFDRLSALAKSRDKRIEMGKAGKQRVLARFDWPVVVRQMEEAWRNLHHNASQDLFTQSPASVVSSNLGSLFSHFTTRAIAPTTLLASGILAGAFEAGEWKVTPHRDLIPFITETALARLMQAFRKSGGAVTLEHLCLDLAGEMPPYQVEHLCLFAIKHGLLRTQ